MLLDVRELVMEEQRQEHLILNKVLHILLSSTRETDLCGWYEDGCVLGTILTELPSGSPLGAVNTILARVNAALLQTLGLTQVNLLRFSFHVFPEVSNDDTSGPISADLKLYPDLVDRKVSRRVAQAIKRSIDVTGSLFLLVLLSPLMIGIAVMIKLTSRGTIFFRQKRVGQYGHPFTFLKFRSMRSNTNAALHREYVTQFISGATQNSAGGNGAGVYKLTKDPRVTLFGSFLRRTSLDELPQLFNVLMGQMSLVGPRPPIPYECACYGTWHRRRLLEAKPGITGLWQVSGRSRTKFDDMVRLDLRYVTSWSLWLDFKIMFQTPRAVFSGDGAY